MKEMVILKECKNEIINEYVCYEGDIGFLEV